MKRALVAICIVCVMGGSGYFIGQYSKGSAFKTPGNIAENETFYKLPLGRFTVQVVKPSRFFNIRFNLDIFITGAANFERMNGGLSRNKMREEVIQHLSNMVETTLWVTESHYSQIDENELARAIAQKLHNKYPMVKTAQLTDLATSRVTR